VNYPDTLEYLYNQLPMFHRLGAAAYKANLDNTITLASLLDNPEKRIKTIHIAGTNGKGSVSNMLASVLQEAGYKTGLYTSPHLKDFRERIRINGKMIDEKEIISFVETYKQSFEEIKPSFFEWTTSLAFYYFANAHVDVAVIETGLGGRLDSTNIITPELSLITNISYDHMQFLGDTLEKIAGEKAGIIKYHIPVVVGERQEKIDEVFLKKSDEVESEIVFASDIYRAEHKSFYPCGQTFSVFKNGKVLFYDLAVGLAGNYQQKNLCTVLQAADSLKNKFPGISERNIIAGLKNIIINTGLKGRWEVIQEEPLTIADVGHNQAGISFVVRQLNELFLTNNKLKDGKLHFIFGMVNDKDPAVILSLLPKNAVYYFCKANLPRAMDADELKNKAGEFFLKGISYSSVFEAYRTAKAEAKINDVIFVGGSTFVVAEII
jgi:dihydrofolate synthase/folylpolyglutamate synthase